jgi:hypothetical protein
MTLRRWGGDSYCDGGDRGDEGDQQGSTAQP